jgi:hypothetical protein
MVGPCPLPLLQCVHHHCSWEGSPVFGAKFTILTEGHSHHTQLGCAPMHLSLLVQLHHSPVLTFRFQGASCGLWTVVLCGLFLWLHIPPPCMYWWFGSRSRDGWLVHWKLHRVQRD